MAITIVNLTPHPVTIYRTRPSDTGSPADRELPPVVYPACKPADLPRAIETPMTDSGCMELSVSGDTQDAYENHWSMVGTGVVDFAGFTGVANLPAPTPDELAFGCTTFRIVSITTAIGALAAGRTIVDLLVPMGQVRDGAGRIIGASGLAPASSLLTSMAQRLIAIGRSAVDMYREQLANARQEIADLVRIREAQDATIMAQQAALVRQPAES